MSLLLWSKSKPAKCFPLIDIYERKNYPAISGRQTCCKGWKALSPDNLAQVPRVRLLQDIVRKLQAAKFLQFPNEGWNWSRSSFISHLLYVYNAMQYWWYHQRSALTKKRDTTTTILISRSCHFCTKFASTAVVMTIVSWTIVRLTMWVEFSKMNFLHNLEPTQCAYEILSHIPKWTFLSKISISCWANMAALLKFLYYVEWAVCFFYWPNCPVSQMNFSPKSPTIEMSGS